MSIGKVSIENLIGLAQSVKGSDADLMESFQIRR